MALGDHVLDLLSCALGYVFESQYSQHRFESQYSLHGDVKQFRNNTIQRQAKTHRKRYILKVDIVAYKSQTWLANE